MRCFSIILFVLPTVALANKVNPITKVIELIEELKSKTLADGKAEELVYNRMACWCETTTKSKADEIKNAQDKLAALSQDINTNKGSIATLAADIHDLMTDISINEAKQYEETTKRERQNADYMQNKAELTNAIVALEQAVQMLDGVDHLVLIQGKVGLSSEQLTAVRAVKSAVLKAMLRLPSDNKIPVHKLSALERLGQKFNNKYSPFEPTITAILKDLLESFKATQETETGNEADLQTSYEEIMESKGNELETKKSLLADKESQKAKENSDQAANEAEWQTTADALVAANKVFGSTKDVCTSLANKWDERKKLREEEVKGIEDALKTLTSDENRALIGKAAADGPGKLDFLQVSSQGTSSSRAQKAYLALRRAATHSHSVSVGALAVKVFENMHQKGDDSWKDDILKKINEILTELGNNQEEDTTTYDNCQEEQHKLNLELDERTHTIKRYNWKLDKLNQNVEDLQAKIAEAAEEVATIKAMQARLTDERNAENREYENEKSDDEGAIGVLESAIGDLSKFYKNQNIDMGKLNEADGKFFIQEGTSDDADQSGDDIFFQKGAVSKHSFLQRSDEPVFKKTDDDVIGEVGSFEFSDKGKRAGQSKGIIGLLTNIKEDLESDIAKATNMENEADTKYQKIMDESDDEVKDLKNKIDDHKDDKSDREGDIDDNEQWKSEEEADLSSAKDEMKTLMTAGDEGKDVSFPCEFMLDQYHSRRKQREAETEGLKEAIAFLEGMQ